jgi:hypothetical protein
VRYPAEITIVPGLRTDFGGGLTGHAERYPAETTRVSFPCQTVKSLCGLIHPQPL